MASGLADFLRAGVIDADQIGHEVLTFPQIKTQISQVFGPSVFVSGELHSEIDRRELAKRVFGAETHHKESLSQLEAIVHPEIRRQMQTQIRQAQTEHDVVLVDAAVMLEAGWDDLCDELVFVDVPFETRLARVVENRGWDEAELRGREASQLPLEKKKQASKFVVDNSRNLNDSVTQLRQIVHSLTKS